MRWRLPDRVSAFRSHRYPCALHGQPAGETGTMQLSKPINVGAAQD
jgi:hypothetical protein